jgi:Anti-sigma-K factor rskA/Putative zinc-finger
MDSHEEFRELCAAATAGELSVEEQARLNAHLAVCPDCRCAFREFDIAAVKGVAAFAADEEPAKKEALDRSWSIRKAEAAFFRRLDREQQHSRSRPLGARTPDPANTGRRFTYRPSQIRWREVWMPFAAAILLALALGVAAYKTGIKRGTDVARTFPSPSKEPESSLEAQVSDAGYDRVQLEAKLKESAKVIEDLKQKLSQQIERIASLKVMEATALHTTGTNQQTLGETKDRRDEELSAAQAKLAELQKMVEMASAQRDENASQGAVLEAKVNDLTQLVSEREQALDRTEAEVARSQELLKHDRDIRDLMGARDLYMADVHDVSGKGTEKTYGRVFYTKGKRLIFYAFDLDAQPGVQNARSFQAWGRRGPDKHQALSLGIFYEDNVSKKRWVLKADDPKSLDDIDAVFVTVEPNGGSQHPSGKQLLFAYLGISPNHP